MLLCSLSATYLCVGLVAQPVAVSQFVGGIRTKEHLPHLIDVKFRGRVKFELGVACDDDCNQRGQTSCLVIWDEIKASCHFKAYSCRYSYNRFVMYFWNFPISLWCSYLAIPLCVLISVF